MGDRTYTSIEFSGRINRATAEGLLEACQAENLTADGTNDEPTLEDLNDRLSHDECNYAQLDAVEEFCKEHAISYCKEWEPGGDYAAGMDIHLGIVNVTYTYAVIDGEPALTLPELKKIKSMEDLEKQVKLLDTAYNFRSHYGPLEIVDDTTKGEDK